VEEFGQVPEDIVEIGLLRLAFGRVVTQISLIAQLRGWRAVVDLLVERVDVWAATIEDRPGGLAQALATLRDAGADLKCIIARRAG